MRKVEARDGIDVARHEHALAHVRVVDHVVLIGKEQMHRTVHHAQSDDAEVVRYREGGNLWPIALGGRGRSLAYRKDLRLAGRDLEDAQTLWVGLTLHTVNAPYLAEG